MLSSSKLYLKHAAMMCSGRVTPDRRSQCVVRGYHNAAAHTSCRRMPFHLLQHPNHVRAEAKGQQGNNCRRRSVIMAYAGCFASATAAATGVSALVQHAPTLAPLLQSAGIFVLCLAGAIFLLACIPAILAAAQAGLRAAAVLRVLEKELPDTLATMRLSGLELTDCIAEVGSLGNELTSGVKASARMVTAAEQGIKTGAAVVDHAVNVKLKGALTSTETAAREQLEQQLKARAQLEYSRAVIGQVTGAVRRLRFGVAATQLATTAVRAGLELRTAMQQSAEATASSSRGSSPEPQRRLRQSPQSKAPTLPVVSKAPAAAPKQPPSSAASKAQPPKKKQ